MFVVEGIEMIIIVKRCSFNQKERVKTVIFYFKSKKGMFYLKSVMKFYFSKIKLEYFQNFHKCD